MLGLTLLGIHWFLEGSNLIRFAERVAKKVGRVTFRVPQQLERLIRYSLPDLPLSVYQPLTTDKHRATTGIDPVFDFPAGANARARDAGRFERYFEALMEAGVLLLDH